MTGITLSVSIYKITTMTDGGYRIQFDCGQESTEQIKALMDHQNDLLQMGLVPIKIKKRNFSDEESINER